MNQIATFTRSSVGVPFFGWNDDTSDERKVADTKMKDFLKGVLGDRFTDVVVGNVRTVTWANITTSELEWITVNFYNEHSPLYAYNQMLVNYYAQHNIIVDSNLV